MLITQVVVQLLWGLKDKGTSTPLTVEGALHVSVSYLSVGLLWLLLFSWCSCASGIVVVSVGMIVWMSVIQLMSFLLHCRFESGTGKAGSTSTEVSVGKLLSKGGGLQHRGVGGRLRCEGSLWGAVRRLSSWGICRNSVRNSVEVEVDFRVHRLFSRSVQISHWMEVVVQ